MRTLATILAVASKEWKVLWRDHTIVAALALQPLILTVIFGYAVRSEVRDAHWVVYDADRTASSRRLVDELVATRKFARPRTATSYAATEGVLRHGDGAVALVIPRDFTRALVRGDRAPVQLLLNGADPLVALRLSAVVREVASRFRPDTDDARRPPSDPPIELRRTIRFNPTLADVVFGVAVRGSVCLLLFGTLVFLLTSYAIAVLFSTLARNTHQAVYLTVFSVLPSTVISGFMVPTSTMPRAIQIAALGLPATHYVTILRAVVVRGAHLADVAAPLVALTAILAIVVAGVLATYPRRLDR